MGGRHHPVLKKNSNNCDFLNKCEYSWKWFNVNDNEISENELQVSSLCPLVLFFEKGKNNIITNDKESNLESVNYSNNLESNFYLNDESSLNISKKCSLVFKNKKYLNNTNSKRNINTNNDNYKDTNHNNQDNNNVIIQNQRTIIDNNEQQIKNIHTLEIINNININNNYIVQETISQNSVYNNQNNINCIPTLNEINNNFNNNTNNNENNNIMLSSNKSSNRKIIRNSFHTNIDIESNKSNNEGNGNIITLNFILKGKELFIDVNISLTFEKVIQQLYSKYSWVKQVKIKGFEFNNNLLANKTIKEIGLKNNSNINIIESN